jgi:hypothetical protein
MTEPQGPVAAPDGTLADTTPSNYVSPLSALCAAGAVRLYRVRATGTTRRVPYLAVDTDQRAVAEWLSDRIDMDGAPLADVAAEVGLSRPNARRLLAALELTEEIDAGDWDDLYEEGVTTLFVGFAENLPSVLLDNEGAAPVEHRDQATLDQFSDGAPNGVASNAVDLSEGDLGR